MAARLLAAAVFLTLSLPVPRLGAQASVPGPTRPASLLDVPFLPQSELLCGGAAAAMVLRYWGATGVDADDFSHLVRPSEGGIRGGELARELDGMGWSAVPFRGDAAEVRHHLELNRPVVALIEVAPDRYHFVVIVAWTDDGVLFHDPARAPFQAMERREFEAAWNPTGRWTLLVLPEEGGDRPATPADEGRSEPGPEPGSEPGSEPEPEPGPADVDAGSADLPPETGVPERDRSDACAASIRDAVALARDGGTERARVLLRDAVDRCPGSSRARAELAGLHAAAQDWAAARRLAGEAVAVDPSDAYAWRILATSRFLTGDRTGALAAWNRVDRPRIERIRIEGLEDTRYAEVQRRTGLVVDRLLTPGAYTTAARRLDLLPSARSTRVEYRPLPEGRVSVTAHLLQHPPLPRTSAAWAGTLLRGLASRSVTLRSGSPLGAGELWSVGGRWEENRPAAVVSVAVPGLPALPGVATLAGGWERQSYLVPDGPAGADGRVRVEERRLARFGLEEWVTGGVRWQGSLGLDRWEHGATDVSAGTAVEVRSGDDLLSLTVDGRLARSWNGDVRWYAAGGVDVRWRSSSRTAGPVLHLRTGGRTSSAGSPLALRPGAGEGRARPLLLRGRPLLDGGVVTGPAFGRSLLHAGAESRWWSGRLPIPVGAAVFVDAARPRGTLTGSDPGILVDVGLGIRAAVPGTDGLLRLDAARPVDGGGWRFQVGWKAAWPGEGAEAYGSGAAGGAALF